MIPGSLLTIGGALALQQAYQKTWLAMLVGTSAIWLGAWVGSNLAMLNGRYLFRDQSKKAADKYKIMGAIDKALEKEGFKFTFLLRLCPLVPFNAFNYIMGVTSVKFWDYALGGLGMIPGTAVYVFIGTTISNIADAAAGKYEKGTAFLVLVIVGTILAFVAIIYISYVVKKYLDKTLEEQKDADAKGNKVDEEKIGEVD